MLNQTLFETLRIIGEDPDKLHYNFTESNIDSILKNLKNTLNTRQGNAQIAHDFGMPDLTNFPNNDISESITDIERLIQTTIERYETRLTNIKVSHIPSFYGNVSLKFSLSAETIGTTYDSKKSVVFETIVVSDGIIKLER